VIFRDDANIIFRSISRPSTVDRARDHEGSSETAVHRLLVGGVPGQGVVVEGVKGGK
jgi:hypothetical protein